MVLTIILFQGLIFAGLIFVLRQFMKGHVSGAVGHLQKLNEEMLKQQAELKAKMSEAEKEYASKMGTAQQELSQSQSKAREEAIKTVDEARVRALAEREKIIQEAVQTRDKMRNEVMAEMEQKAILYSKEVVAQLFTGEPGKLIHELLVKETIEGLKEMDAVHFQVQDPRAQLKIAQPLSVSERQAIQKVLEEKIKKKVELQEEEDPSLVAGFVLQFGNFVIDGSLTNRLNEAAARLRKETVRKYQGSV